MKSQLEYGSWHADDWYLRLSKILRAQCDGLLTAEAWLWQREDAARTLTICLAEDDAIPGAEPIPSPEFDLLALLRAKLETDSEFTAIEDVEAMAMQFRAMARLCDETAQQMRADAGESPVDYAKDPQPQVEPR